jgi:hypothetical protein
MCLVISGVFCYLAYGFFLEGDMITGSINSVIALFFLGLLIRNIIKTRNEKKSNG